MDKNNEKMFQSIREGIFKDTYLIYNRRSTDEPDSQKNSLQYQKVENMKFADRNGFPIARVVFPGFCLNGVISEKHSGFKEDTQLTFGEDGTVQYRIERPKFYQMVQYLNKGYFKGVIILCWDRASRNKGDDTILNKLIKQGVDVRFTLATYDKTSSGALHMDIDSMFAAHHSRVTSEKVRINMEMKRREGICTYKAPVGYLNEGNMEHKPFDPERSLIVKKMFELAATEEWSLWGIADWAIQQGFTMPPVRRRRTREEILMEEEDEQMIVIEPTKRLPTADTIHKILKNRFYMGEIMLAEGGYVKSRSHKALVSKDLFLKVREVLEQKNTSKQYSFKIHYPLRGLVRCGECSRLYTPYSKKGIQYYASRCAVDCSNSNKNFNFKYISDKIGKALQKLIFTDEQLAEIQARTHTDLQLTEYKYQQKLENNQRQKTRIRAKLKFLTDKRSDLLFDGAYTGRSIVEEEEKLQRELFKLRDQEAITDCSMFELRKDVITLSELLKSLYLKYEKAKPEEIEQIARIMFSELSIFENILSFKCKKGFHAFENHFVALGDPLAWFSDLATFRLDIKASIKELKQFLKKS